MRFALLGSGSRGNAALIECDTTCLLLDCGLPLKELTVRLAHLARHGEQLSGIVVTHEHGDHCQGMGAVARRYNLPIWMTPGTYSAIAPRAGRLPRVELLNPHEPFAIGGIELQPFPVPHDAREPVQFVFFDGKVRLGFMTDTGHATAHIESMLSGCEALVLECNHDRDMLARGEYPPPLKVRVGGPQGHLDNAAAGELLARVDTSALQHVVAAHLSQKNNTPELARTALSRALGCDPAWVQVADQDRGMGWREISAWV